MKAQQLADNIFCVHADIRTDELFEGIWPIPHGVTLNSYVVKGEKVALIDFVRDWTDATAQHESALKSVGLDFTKVDYLILNHLEPDHTGYLAEFRAMNPKAEILATEKGVKLIQSFYKIDSGLRAVKDGDTLDLGLGKKLTFFETPNLHWPETMVTWEADSGTLFTCDAFGSYGALGDRIFDDQYTEAEHAAFEEESLRYYANIVSSFSLFVEQAVAKLGGLQIRCIAPSHGIVWRTNPGIVKERYLKYASFAKGGEASITIIWGSMYGNTKRGLDAVIRGIESAGVPYSSYRVPNDNISYILAAAYKSRALVLAMPTYEYAMFPPMSYVLDIFRRKHLKHKTVLRIGSWGWAGGAKKDYEKAIEGLDWTSLESVEWPGQADALTMAALEKQGRELALQVGRPEADAGNGPETSHRPDGDAACKAEPAGTSASGEKQYLCKRCGLVFKESELLDGRCPVCFSTVLVPVEPALS